jgi:hypothetical protein
MNNLNLLGFVILLMISLVSQLISGDLVLPEKIDEKWIAQKPVKIYRGDQLFSHIDGGAELFLEFGFKDLTVCKYGAENITLDLEVYKMENQIAALGIYLNKTGHETPLKDLSARNTANQYQIVFTSGRYFVLVNNFSGKKQCESPMIHLSQTIISQIEKTKAEDVFKYLPTQKIIEGSKTIFRGPFGLQSVYTFGKGDILLQKGKIFGVSANYRTDSNNYITNLVVLYQEPASAKQAYDHLVSNLDPYYEIINKFNNYFVFKDYDGKYGKVRIEESLIKIELHLHSYPE